MIEKLPYGSFINKKRFAFQEFIYALKVLLMAKNCLIKKLKAT